MPRRQVGIDFYRGFIQERSERSYAASLTAAPFFRGMARRTGRSLSQYSSQAVVFFSNLGTDLSVYFDGSRPVRTCAHVRGIETGACGLARGESGATAVAKRSFRR